MLLRLLNVHFLFVVRRSNEKVIGLLVKKSIEITDNTKDFETETSKSITE